MKIFLPIGDPRGAVAAPYRAPHRHGAGDAPGWEEESVGGAARDTPPPQRHDQHR